MQDDKLDNISLFKHFCSKSINLTATEKLVAMVLLSHRNNISMVCCPGLTLLAEETGFTRRCVQMTTKSLIIKKEIVRLPIKNGNLYLKSQYYFLYDIDKAKEIYENEESIFLNHHYAEVDNFEHCLKYNLFKG